MSLDFQHIPLGSTPGARSLSIDGLLEVARTLSDDSDPRVPEFKRRANQIKDNAHGLCRDAMKALVPNIDSLESTYPTDPSILRIKILEQIELTLTAIEDHKSGSRLKI